MKQQTYLTLKEVAERFRVSEATIRYWRHCGTGPRAVRFGRRLLYLAADVERWEQEQLTKASEPR